ncbi:molybdopterin converting factor subunit 1 [Microbulbifer hainanensis]|uniref:molybdopterin converting factor subunit 1 n=1 Tax=Microbulbifer hainanensis TaxID=2735675 RepID=UPI001868001B|nr:molybdopterin converting factor subunit 1 [Microbulbifer hainanensis]
MIRVLFFASLREQLGTGEMRLDDFSGDIAALRESLCGERPEWRQYLASDPIRTALNQVLVGADATVADGDEVAFFPPVTGG